MDGAHTGRTHEVGMMAESFRDMQSSQAGRREAVREARVGLAQQPRNRIGSMFITPRSAEGIE